MKKKKNRTEEASEEIVSVFRAFEPGESVYIWAGDMILCLLVEGIFISITKNGTEIEYEFEGGRWREKEKDVYSSFEEAKQGKIKKIKAMKEEDESIVGLIESEKGDHE